MTVVGAWHIGVAHGRVGDDHLVAAVGMGEEVIDPLFLHEPAGEVEVGLAVLDAVVAGLVGPLELVVDVRPVRTCLRMSGTAICWKIRLWALRVSSQSWGTISAW